MNSQPNLEEVVNAQQKQIADQQKQIDSLSELTRKLQTEIHQLIGGLYNQSTQVNTIYSHLEHIDIDSGRNPERVYQDTSKWSQWPTTRQGDDLENRLDKLEQKVLFLEKNNAYTLPKAWTS